MWTLRLKLDTSDAELSVSCIWRVLESAEDTSTMPSRTYGFAL